MADRSKRMGRPPLDVKATTVRLQDGTAERIDALVGKNRRSDFIRDAIEKALDRFETEHGHADDKEPP